MSRRNAKKRPSAAEQLKLIRSGTDGAPPAANQTPPPGETTPPAGDAPNEAPPAGASNETSPNPPADPPPPQPPPPSPPPPEPDPDLARLSVHLADIPEGVYVSRHVDVQLTTPQARALRRVLEGLMNHGARLANGRRVTTSADAVRFLLDQLESE